MKNYSFFKLRSGTRGPPMEKSFSKQLPHIPIMPGMISLNGFNVVFHIYNICFQMLVTFSTWFFRWNLCLRTANMFCHTKYQPQRFPLKSSKNVTNIWKHIVTFLKFYLNCIINHNTAIWISGSSSQITKWRRVSSLHPMSWQYSRIRGRPCLYGWLLPRKGYFSFKK